MKTQAKRQLWRVRVSSSKKRKNKMETHTRNFMLRAYLNRELDADTEAEFEIELLRDPELAELASADTALMVGLSASSGAVVELPIPAKVAAPRTQLPKLAVAASVLMAIAAALGYAFKPAPQILGGAQLAYIDKHRFLENTIQIKLPENGPIVLMVPVASANACVADILLTQSNQTISAKSKPDKFGYAVVVLANAALKPGIAMISVRCQGAQIGQYEVQVLP
jgi:hypothetical protein